MMENEHEVRHQEHTRPDKGPPSDERPPEKEDWLTIGLANRPFAKACPSTPAEYCDENRDWAQLMYLWCLQAQGDMEDCLCGKAKDPLKALPSKRCGDWQGAWGELRAFALSIRPFLKALEAMLKECTGVKIRARLPTPRGSRLPGPDSRLHAQACRRARHYFKQVEAWGTEISDAYNEHCEDEHPTHLKPPPDPPF